MYDEKLVVLNNRTIYVFQVYKTSLYYLKIKLLREYLVRDCWGLFVKVAMHFIIYCFTVINVQLYIPNIAENKSALFYLFS